MVSFVCPLFTILIAEPCLVNALKLNDEPRLAKPKIESAEPVLAKDLKDIDEPRCK
jgi:hypothetical protein